MKYYDNINYLIEIELLKQIVLPVAKKHLNPKDLLAIDEAITAQYSFIRGESSWEAVDFVPFDEGVYWVTIIKEIVKVALPSNDDFVITSPHPETWSIYSRLIDPSFTGMVPCTRIDMAKAIDKVESKAMSYYFDFIWRNQT